MIYSLLSRALTCILCHLCFLDHSWFFFSILGNSVKRRGKLLSHFTTSRPKFKRKHLAGNVSENADPK